MSNNAEEIRANLEAIHDAMLEELGISRRTALPLADHRIPVSSTPVPAPRIANAWNTFIFTDVDPATQPEAIADGLLARSRRGGSANLQQPHRGGGPRGGHGAYGGGSSRGGQYPSRGGGGYGGFVQQGNRGGRASVGKRTQDAIQKLRNTPSAAPALMPARGQASSRGIRVGGAIRGARGGTAPQNNSTRQRQHRSIPDHNLDLSTERFLTSVNAQFRAPPVQTGTSANANQAGLAQGNAAVVNPTPPHLCSPVVPVAQSPPRQAPGGPTPQTPNQVVGGLVKLTENRGIRIRLAGQNTSFTAAYTIYHDGDLKKLVVQRDVDDNNSPCINDLITPRTTLYVNVDVCTTVTYCAHEGAGVGVFEIVFPMPHEAVGFQKDLLPEGPQDNLHPAPSGPAPADIPEIIFTPAQESSPVSTQEVNHDLLGVEAPEAADPLARSAMMDLGTCAVAQVDPILGLINQQPEGSFMDRLFALAPRVSLQSTVDGVCASGEALRATATIVKDFFSTSPLFASLTEMEMDSYISMIKPDLLAHAYRLYVSRSKKENLLMATSDAGEADVVRLGDSFSGMSVTDTGSDKSSEDPEYQIPGAYPRDLPVMMNGSTSVTSGSTSYSRGSYRPRSDAEAKKDLDSGLASLANSLYATPASALVAHPTPSPALSPMPTPVILRSTPTPEQAAAAAERLERSNAVLSKSRYAVSSPPRSNTSRFPGNANFARRDAVLSPLGENHQRRY